VTGGRAGIGSLTEALAIVKGKAGTTIAGPVSPRLRAGAAATEA
jgi:hypothetical protein